MDQSQETSKMICAAKVGYDGGMRGGRKESQMAWNTGWLNAQMTTA